VKEHTEPQGAPIESPWWRWLKTGLGVLIALLAIEAWRTVTNLVVSGFFDQLFRVVRFS